MQKTLLGTAVACALAACSPRTVEPDPVAPVLGADLTEPATDAELEQKIEALKPTAPRITKEHIQSLIVDETYTSLEGTRTTVCRLQLANGFCVVGVNNGPVSAANFSQEIGCEYAYKAAVDQIWPLEGYLLAERLFAGDVHLEKVGKLRELLAIQLTPGTIDQGEYMRGLAVALSVFDGQAPDFVEAPAHPELSLAASRLRLAQDVLARHAPPDGIGDAEALNDLYHVLDAPLPGAAVPSHQDRVRLEHAELVDRAQKLGAFFATPVYADLPNAEQGRLLDQHALMGSYATVLAERIAAF